MSDIEKIYNLKVTKPRGKLQRVSGDQILFAREFLLQVSLRVEPDHQTQRRTFSRILPVIYYLKVHEGCTLKSITKYLNEIGIALSYSSARVYYSKMLPKRMQECFDKAKELQKYYQSAREKNRFSNNIDQ